MADELLERDSARHLCLFGLGALLDECFDQVVLSLGRAPDYLCDNAPRKWGRPFHGVTCLSPEELRSLGRKLRVVITVRSYERIADQLLAMGFSDLWALQYERGYNRISAIRRIGGEPAPSDGPSALLSVRGRWTLVTGSARGLGRRIALEMARLGSNVIVHGRAPSHLEGIAAECSRLGVGVVPLAAELSGRGQLESLLSEVERAVPQVDIVFNNAAVSPPCASGFWEAPAEDFLASYQINVMAPARICQRLIPPMVRRGFGRVVCLTSSLQRRPGEMAYACSKAALDKLVHDLAPSLAGTGVGLSLADPGWLKTDMGGAKAPLEIDSAFPGALLGALLDADVNGRWISSQDFSGMALAAAAAKAMLELSFGVDPLVARREL